jgi:hypothetical protein
MLVRGDGTNWKTEKKTWREIPKLFTLSKARKRRHENLENLERNQLLYTRECFFPRPSHSV